MYCAQLWCNYTEATMCKLKVAYNNCLRRLLGFSKFCRASGMFVESGIKSFGEIMRSYIHSFQARIYKSQNVLVTAVSDNMILNKSPVMQRWRKELYTDPTV